MSLAAYIPSLIGMCWIAPFFSSRAHVNSPALEPDSAGPEEALS